MSTWSSFETFLLNLLDFWPSAAHAFRFFVCAGGAHGGAGAFAVAGVVGGATGVGFGVTDIGAGEAGGWVRAPGVGVGTSIL